MSAPTSRRTFVRRMAGLGALAALTGCAAPLALTPQVEKIHRIGFLSANTSATDAPYLEIFREAMRQLGYVEDRDYVLELRIAEAINERLPAMAAQLVALRVDVFVAGTGDAARAAGQATDTIPIVFLNVNDPVGLGLISSLGRPGANMTGVATLSGALGGKKLELLRETTPSLRRVAILWNARLAAQTQAFREAEEAARALTIVIDAFSVRDSAELDLALHAMATRRHDAVLTLPAFRSWVGQVAEFAIANRLPYMASDPRDARDGALMALGPDNLSHMRVVAGLVDKILKGASPADLPVYQPTQFEFVINLATAERLGMTVPESVLRRATEVVR